MAQLPLTNVITISATAANPGVGNYNTSNLALFTDDGPNLATFGSAGYASYLSPTQVGIDFGTSSKTYAMANAVFSQQPNILLGGGQLIVILLVTGNQSVLFSAAPVSGAFVLSYNSNPAASIAFGDTAAAIQTKLRAVTGLSQVVVAGSIAANTLTVQFYGVYGAALLLTVSSNTLNASITVTPTVVTAGETLAAAITRTTGTIQYFGILVNESVGTSQVIPSADVTAAAIVVLPLVKMLFLVSNSQSDIVATTGLFSTVQIAGYYNTRCLYYGDATALGVGIGNALAYAASYAGRALSVVFSGSNTTSTMHLKQLPGVAADPTMTQTILNTAIAAGADIYVSLQGVNGVFCSGLNQFFDQVYNLLWFTGALQVAGFNYLAGSNTKLPQTESGMDGLKGAYRAVCQQAVTNQYCAPGVWNSATTFGNQSDLIANVLQVGYYIYSVPLSQQSQADRTARKASLVQIALKQAGALQSSAVIVNVNA